MDFTNPEENKTLLYDLRQIYAVDVVGVWLKYINEACANDDYVAWFKGLKNLKTKASKNFSEEQINELTKQFHLLVTTIEQHEEAFLNTTHNHSERGEIEEQLRAYEEMLLKFMEEGGMFGRGFEYDEDEI